MLQKMLAFVAFLIFVNPANGLVGFDCGGQHLNITSVSLLGVSDCNLDYNTPNYSNVYIQLLQLSEFNYAEVIQCKVEISRRIQYCGMHSHISSVNNARMEYILEIGYSKCLRMFQDGTLTVGPAGSIDGLKPNSTTARSIMLAGTARNDGTCQGTQYSDPYGTWDNVIVDAIVRISLKSTHVPVHLNTGKVMLKSGTVCALSDGFCIDSEDGYTFWKPIPTSSCSFHQYDILYEGPATKMTTDISASPSPTIYSLTTEDITFALTKTKELPLCGYTLLRTEHPKLFILETKKDNAIVNRGSIPVNNLDIFTYVNSKFVYVEKHIRQQLNSLYHNVMQQRCELEKEVLKNTLSFATLQPDEFAYKLMKGPGYMAVTAGETIHVVKCIPVDVTLRRTNECYSELPVTVRNASLFLTPKSRVITKRGTLRECSFELPVMYHMEDTWIQFTPEPHVRQMPPQQLKPLTSLSWKYATPGPLAMSGIYSQTDIEKLRDHIMFPAEKPALLNAMARGLSGHTVQDGAVSMYNLLDEDSLQKIAESTATRIWSGFITFGSATAGVFGVLIVVRLIKLTVDTAIHGYALHSAYGCSLYILGAIWSSLTNLLLYLAGRTTKDIKKTESTDPANTPLSIITNNQGHETTIYSTVPTQVETYKRTPTIYTDLNERLQSFEQIPSTASEFVLNKGGVVTSPRQQA